MQHNHQDIHVTYIVHAHCYHTCTVYSGLPENDNTVYLQLHKDIAVFKARGKTKFTLF